MNEKSYMGFQLVHLPWPILKVKVMHISTWISWKWWEIKRKLLLPSNSHVWAFFWRIYSSWSILKFNVMYGLSFGVSTGDLGPFSRSMSCMGFLLAYLQVILVHSQGQCHVWAFFWRIYMWSWSILKVNVMYISTMNIFEMVTYRIEITIAIK